MSTRFLSCALTLLAGSSLLGCSDSPSTPPDGGADVVRTDAPATDAPATDAPATDAPATDAPAMDAPATDAPATDASATDASATDAPATDAPAGDGGLATACAASGGTVTTSQCCQSTGDFPNTCSVGACGCAPASSHSVMTCACPTGQCFDGARCVMR